MNLDVQISLHEATEILREGLQKKFGETICGITLVSYQKPLIHIALDQGVANDAKTPTHRWDCAREFTHYSIP